MSTYYAQPRFSARIQTLASPILGQKYGVLKRGFMIWDRVLPSYKQKAVVHYLYNPSTVEADYSTGATAAGNASQYSALYPVASNSGNLVIPMTQNSTWTIMFDRTFELMGQGNNKGTNINDPSVAGVGVDVLQMMQFTGMLMNTGGATASSGTSGVWPTVMQLVPAYAYFGGTGPNNVRYYGYINEWNVTYTHFTQNMVPQRCVVNVSWTMLPPPANVQTPSDSNTNWVRGGFGGQGGIPFPKSGVGGR